jgi:Flp pilus assembly protein TadB
MPAVIGYVLWPMLGAFGLTLLLVAQPLGAPRPRLREWLARQDVALREAERARRLAPSAPVVPWPAIDRVLGPLLADGVALIGRLQGRLGWTSNPQRLAEIRLVRPGTTATSWLFKRLVVAGLLSAAPALIGALFGVLQVPDAFVGAVPSWAWVCFGFVGYLAPDWAVNYDLSRRREQMRAAVPALLQTLVIGSSAGLTLQACLRLVASEGSGPLVEVIRGVMRDLDAGRLQSTAEALEALGAAAAIPEVDRLVQRLVGNTTAGAGFQTAARELALALQAEDRAALRASGQVRVLKQLGVAAAFLLLPILAVFFFPLVVMVKDL